MNPPKPKQPLTCPSYCPANPLLLPDHFMFIFCSFLTSGRVIMRGRVPKMPFLIVDGDDPQRELEFELNYLLSLTTQQRYALMLRRSIDTYERMIRHGHIPAVEITQRPSRKIHCHRRKRDARTRLRPSNRRH